MITEPEIGQYYFLDLGAHERWPVVLVDEGDVPKDMQKNRAAAYNFPVFLLEKDEM